MRRAQRSTKRVRYTEVQSDEPSDEQGDHVSDEEADEEFEDDEDVDDHDNDDEDNDDDEMAAERIWDPTGMDDYVLDAAWARRRARARALDRIECAANVEMMDNTPIRTLMVTCMSAYPPPGTRVFLYLKEWGKHFILSCGFSAIDLFNLMATNREYRNLMTPYACGVRGTLSGSSQSRCFFCFVTGRRIYQHACHPCNVKIGIALEAARLNLTHDRDYNDPIKIEDEGHPFIVTWSELERNFQDIARVNLKLITAATKQYVNGKLTMREYTKVVTTCAQHAVRSQDRFPSGKDPSRKPKPRQSILWPHRDSATK
jgi:hypothetical protein